MPNFVQSNFNGEWSPKMLGRVQLARFATASRRMLNFLPTIEGPMRKRAGTEHLAPFADETTKSRIRAFQFSDEARFLLEFDDQIVRFWQDGAYLGDTEVTPFLEAELRNLFFAGIHDVVYISSGTHPIQELSRDEPTNWSFGEFALKNEPFEDENVTTTTLMASALTGLGVTLTASTGIFSAAHVGSRYEIRHLQKQAQYESTITRSKAGLDTSWNPDGEDYSAGDRIEDAGNFYTCLEDWTRAAWADATAYALNDVVTNGGAAYVCILAHTSEALASVGVDDGAGDNEPGIGADWATNWKEVTLPSDSSYHFGLGVVALDADGTEIDYTIYGAWNFRTEANWTAEWQIQESDDDGATWTTRYQMSSTSGSDNYTREGDETDDPIRIRLVLISGSDDSDLVTFTALETERSGIVEVKTYNSTTEVLVDVQTDLFSTNATTKWSENEWNPRRGYPVAVIFWENRLIALGTKLESQSIWGSRKDQWDDFKRGSVETEAPFKDVLFTGQQNPIRWASTQQQLLIGLSDSVRSLFGEEGRILAPGKNQSQRQAGKGSSTVEPVEIDDVTFYVQAGGRKVRASSADITRGVNAAPDMTREAEHVTAGGIVGMVFQQNPDAMLYCWTGDGKIAAMIFEPEQEKLGWVRLELEGGFVEDMAVLQTDEEEDEVYMIVKRTIDGATRRYLERLKTGQIRVREAGTMEDVFGSDCAKTFTGSQFTTVTGAGHLEGEEVTILADGAIHPPKTVTGGEIALDYPCDKVTYGLPLVGEFWGMPMEGIGGGGSTSGKKKRLTHFVISLMNTVGLRYGTDPDALSAAMHEAPFRDATQATSGPVSAFTGDKELRPKSPRDYEGGLYLRHDYPTPCFVRKIATEWEQTS